MIYKKFGKVVLPERAKRIVHAAQAYLDGFYDESEGDSLWDLAHEQSSQGYTARDMIEANADGFTMRHANEEGN